MEKKCCEIQNEITVEPEVFQNMDDFELPKEYSCFGMAIRLQFPKFSRGMNASDFKSFIDEYVGAEHVVALGRLAFPNEWQIQLSNKDVREKLIRLEKTKISMRSCWISPLSQSEVRGTIHWLPIGIPDEDVNNQLKAYGQVLFIERQNQTKFDLRFQSDVRYFGLFLRSGQTMDDIPHFMFFNKFQGYVSIRGRSPVCFHCRTVGHRKNECKAFYEKLGMHCSRMPGRIQRERPRGRRWRSLAQIQYNKSKASTSKTEDNPSENKMDVTESPSAQDEKSDMDKPNPTNVLGVEVDIVKTLSNTEVLSEEIEVAARYICGELQKNKKKKKKQKKRSGQQK